MPNLEISNNINRTVEIGNDHIKYYDSFLKISNISHTWIFKFRNIERQRYEDQKRIYENNKKKFELDEQRKKHNSVRNLIIVGVGCLLLAIIAFIMDIAVASILLLCVTIVVAFLAYKKYNKPIEYPFESPTAGFFPDKFGLGIEMNSGYVVTFTAVGNDGLKVLRQLQLDIDNANSNKETIIFNMNDYDISVENNEGVINTGDNSDNKVIL